MKLEIEKQIQADGRIFYHILKDGLHVSGSTDLDLAKVEELFERIKTFGDIERIEIIRSEEI